MQLTAVCVVIITIPSQYVPIFRSCQGLPRYKYALLMCRIYDMEGCSSCQCLWS